jgi:hypothetical protein
MPFAKLLFLLHLKTPGI